MSDNNGARQASTKSQHYFMPVFLFVLAALALHPVFFIGALACLVAAQVSRQRQIIVGLCSVVLVLAAFGYSAGKDLALRDNARDAKIAAGTDKTP